MFTAVTAYVCNEKSFANCIAFEAHKRTVTGNDGYDVDYYNVSMSPANWYQWFDPAQPTDDKEWETVSNIHPIYTDLIP